MVVKRNIIVAVVAANIAAEDRQTSRRQQTERQRQAMRKLDRILRIEDPSQTIHSPFPLLIEKKSEDNSTKTQYIRHMHFQITQIENMRV